MRNFRNDLINKIDEKLNNTNFCGGVSDPNYFTWENLESGVEISVIWDMNDDDKVQVEIDYSPELEYDSLEDAIENINEIVEFILENN